MPHSGKQTNESVFLLLTKYDEDAQKKDATKTKNEGRKNAETTAIDLD